MSLTSSFWDSRAASMHPNQLSLTIELRAALDRTAALLHGTALWPPSDNVAPPSQGAFTILFPRYYECAVLVGRIRLLLSALNHCEQLNIARLDDDELEAAILYRDAMRKSIEESSCRGKVDGVLDEYPMVCFSPIILWNQLRGRSEAASKEESQEAVRATQYHSIEVEVRNGLITIIGVHGVVGDDVAGVSAKVLRKALLDRGDEIERCLLEASAKVDDLARKQPTHTTNARQHLACVLLQTLLIDISRAALILGTTSSSLEGKVGAENSRLLSELCTIAKSIVNSNVLDGPCGCDNDEAETSPAYATERQAVLSSLIAQVLSLADDALLQSPHTLEPTLVSSLSGTGRVCPLTAQSIPSTANFAKLLAETREWIKESKSDGDEEMVALQYELCRLVEEGAVHPFAARYLQRVL